MSETKATPGPWSVLAGIPRGGGIGIGPDIEGIGPHCIVTFNGGASEANARLIAATPELRQLVSEALEHFSDNDSEMDVRDWVKVATVILAKIEGTK